MYCVCCWILNVNRASSEKVVVVFLLSTRWWYSPVFPQTSAKPLPLCSCSTQSYCQQKRKSEKLFYVTYNKESSNQWLLCPALRKKMTACSVIGMWTYRIYLSFCGLSLHSPLWVSSTKSMSCEKGGQWHMTGRFGWRDSWWKESYKFVLKRPVFRGCSLTGV